MNSRATSVTRLRLHRSAVVGSFVLWREIYHRAILDFCNTIGTSATSQRDPPRSAYEVKAVMRRTFVGQPLLTRTGHWPHQEGGHDVAARSPLRPALETVVGSAEKQNEYEGQQERKGHKRGNLVC